MRTQATGYGVAEAFDGALSDVADGVTQITKDATDFTKLYWRQQVRAAGFSARLAGTIQGRVYPDKQPSLDPAGFLTTKAPEIMASIIDSIVIRPSHTGRYEGQAQLWIPTGNVPRATPRKLMTPEQVEAFFDQKFIIRSGQNGHYLAFINAVSAKSGKGFRRATKGRLKQGRESKLVLMFTLVSNVRTIKRLDIDVIAARGQAYLADGITKYFGA